MVRTACLARGWHCSLLDDSRSAAGLPARGIRGVIHWNGSVLAAPLAAALDASVVIETEGAAGSGAWLAAIVVRLPAGQAPDPRPGLAAVIIQQSARGQTMNRRAGLTAVVVRAARQEGGGAAVCLRSNSGRTLS